MSWPMPNSGAPPVAPWNQGMAMMPNMNSMPPAYTAADQWTLQQQQNWQQWAQWQQQYAQWQSQYGDKYAEQMQMHAMASGVAPPPPPSSAAPPNPPPPALPPSQPPPPTQPPPHENNQPLFSQPKHNPVPVPPPTQYNQANTNTAYSNYPTGNNQNWSYTESRQNTAQPTNPPVNVEALKSLEEEERLFDIQFSKWEEEIDKWRKDNINHPDKQAYKEYEAKFEACRVQLMERRQQMKIKRARLTGNPNKPTGNNIVVTPTATNTMQGSNAYKNNQNTNSNNYSNPQSNNYSIQKPPQHNKNIQNKQYNDRGPPPTPRSNNVNIDPHDRYDSYQNMDNYGQEDNNYGQEDNNYGQEDNYEEAAGDSGFLQTSGSQKGIPGLDLVPDAGNLPVPNPEVIDITADPSEPFDSTNPPDYSNISKGINNILGDAKIMNILSMVRDKVAADGNITTPTPSIPPLLATPIQNPLQRNQWDAAQNSFNNQQGNNGAYWNNQQQSHQQNQPPPGRMNNNQFGNQYNDGSYNDQEYNADGTPMPNRPPRTSRPFDNQGFNGNRGIQDGRGMQGNNRMQGNRGMPMQDNRGMPMQDKGASMQNNRGMPMQDRGMPMQDRGMPMQERGMPMQDRGIQDNRSMPMQDNNRMPMRNRGMHMQDGGTANMRPMQDMMMQGNRNLPLMSQPPPPPPQPKWKEDPLFTPSIIVEYDHKPLRVKAREFIEPVHTFDYKHISKDNEYKRQDFESEVEGLFSRKPRSFEEDYMPERDRYVKDERTPRDFERRMPREDLRDPYRAKPYDDFDDRRRPLRPEERRRDDRDTHRRDDRDPYGRDSHVRREDRDTFSRRDDRDVHRRDDARDRDVHRRDDTRDRERDRDFNRDRFREHRSERSISHDRDNRKRARSKDSEISEISKKPKDVEMKGIPGRNVIMIDDILEPPGRDIRPEKIVIILRGPPGSGKSYLAKLIRDKEAEYGGTVRIMSIDDYFMQEGEVEEKDPATGKTVKKPSLKYEYDDKLEESYLNSLKRAFKRSITDGYFSFLIYDAENFHLKCYADIWNFSRQNGFHVYVCTMDLDPNACFKRNIHNRSLNDIVAISHKFMETPSHHSVLDPTTLLQSASITDVHMEDAVDEVIQDDIQETEHLTRKATTTQVESSFTSKWEKMDNAAQLARLDGTSKPLRPSQLSMEDYLQVDDWKPNAAKPGKKTVRWADIEERREQEKMRAIGFVVGQTDWNRMTDPTMGSSALTKTKYIERVRRNNY